MHSSILESVQVDDLVRLGVNGVSQFKVLEVDETRALIKATLVDAPGAYPFYMRLVDLVAWVDD